MALKTIYSWTQRRNTGQILGKVLPHGDSQDGWRERREWGGKAVTLRASRGHAVCISFSNKSGWGYFSCYKEDNRQVHLVVWSVNNQVKGWGPDLEVFEVETRNSGLEVLVLSLTGILEKSEPPSLFLYLWTVMESSPRSPSSSQNDLQVSHTRSPVHYLPQRKIWFNENWKQF